MTVVTMKVKGLDGIDRALTELQESVRADVLEDVLTESADPFLVDYTYDAPPVIRRGVRVRTVDKSPRVASVAVGSRHPLAHIFEYGTRIRRTNKGARRGKIEKVGFARRAFDTNVSRWFGSIGRLFWQEIKRVRS